MSVRYDGLHHIDRMCRRIVRHWHAYFLIKLHIYLSAVYFFPNRSFSLAMTEAADCNIVRNYKEMLKVHVVNSLHYHRLSCTTLVAVRTEFQSETSCQARIHLCFCFIRHAMHPLNGGDKFKSLDAHF